jgi:hypothetical protein
MFQIVFMDFMISKKKQISFFFSNVVWNLCVFSKKKNILCLFNFIQKYVLFQLNMLRLFQEINMFFFFEIKIVFNKNFSLKYLIQGFNPHLLR